jgi:hypothetical protein
MKMFRMKLFRAAALFALLTGPAYAQMMPDVNLIPEIKSKTPEEIEQDKLTDKAYRESLRKIPDAKASSDPWGNVRSADTPKSDTKSAAQPKPRAKTGSASAAKAGSAAN